MNLTFVAENRPQIVSQRQFSMCLWDQRGQHGLEDDNTENAFLFSPVKLWFICLWDGIQHPCLEASESLGWAREGKRKQLESRGLRHDDALQ